MRSPRARSADTRAAPAYGTSWRTAGQGVAAARAGRRPVAAAVVMEDALRRRRSPAPSASSRLQTSASGGVQRTLTASTSRTCCAFPSRNCSVSASHVIVRRLRPRSQARRAVRFSIEPTCSSGRRTPRGESARVSATRALPASSRRQSPTGTVSRCSQCSSMSTTARFAMSQHGAIARSSLQSSRVRLPSTPLAVQHVELLQLSHGPRLSVFSSSVGLSAVTVARSAARRRSSTSMVS